jgi:hypothetical protein
MKGDIMAHKTFISYKYSEAQDLRDDIIDALGDNATYYQGETSDSPDLTDYTTETIREHLKDMIFGTTVTIVILSPNMTKSKWIDWEIEYSLREYSRNGKTSKSNGIVAVIQKRNGGYDWLKSITSHEDGHTSIHYDESKMYDIINSNRFNQDPKEYSCSKCKTVNALTGSYIAIVTEADFLEDPNKYIENAYDKCRNISNYKISKTR